MANEEEENITIQVGDYKHIHGVINYPVTASWRNKYGVILTHGAGGDCDSYHLVQLKNALIKHGFLVIRFTCKPPNFQFRVKCYKAVVEFCKNSLKASGFIIAGKSMGGRVAAEIATQCHSFDGSVYGVGCFSYPLHKPKGFNEMRVSHLKHLSLPVFIVNGTNDNLCKLELMNKLIESMHCNVTMHWIKDADHSMKVKDKTSKEVLEKITQWFVEWCQSVFSVEIT